MTCRVSFFFVVFQTEWVMWGEPTTSSWKGVCGEREREEGMQVKRAEEKKCAKNKKQNKAQQKEEVEEEWKSLLVMDRGSSSFLFVLRSTFSPPPVFFLFSFFRGDVSVLCQRFCVCVCVKVCLHVPTSLFFYQTPHRHMYIHARDCRLPGTCAPKHIHYIYIHVQIGVVFFFFFCVSHFGNGFSLFLWWHCSFFYFSLWICVAVLRTVFSLLLCFESIVF